MEYFCVFMNWNTRKYDYISSHENLLGMYHNNQYVFASFTRELDTQRYLKLLSTGADL